MGFQINIGKSSTVYVTYNFSSLIKYGYCTVSFFFGRKGKDIAKIIKYTLEKMINNGIHVGSVSSIEIPIHTYKSISNIDYGIKNDGKMAEGDQFAEMYSHKLRQLLYLAELFPEEIWVDGDLYSYKKSKKSLFEHDLVPLNYLEDDTGEPEEDSEKDPD